MKNILVAAFLFLSAVAGVKCQTTYITDTIYGRPPHAYIPFWYDTCSCFVKGGEEFCMTQRSHWFDGSTHIFFRVATQHPLLVEGLGVMVDDDWVTSCGTRHWYCYNSDSSYLPPQYIYLFESLDGTRDSLVNRRRMRWDTITPSILKLPHKADLSTGYDSCYYFEVFFDSAIVMDTDFYIALNHTSHASDAYPMITPFRQQLFVDMEHWGMWSMCVPPDIHLRQPATQEYQPPPINCFGVDSNNLSRWNYSGPYIGSGPVFALVTTKGLRVLSNDSERGRVLGEGYYQPHTLHYITAMANANSCFVQWSDGDTSNPRAVMLEQDTVFTAIFEPRHQITALVSPDNSGWVSVEEDDLSANLTLEAHAFDSTRFVGWEDGSTDPHRGLRQTCDTVVTAYFRNAEQYRLRVQVDPPEAAVFNRYDTVVYEGSRIYIIAEEETRGFTFSHWDDLGEDQTQNPWRWVKVESDTVLVAHFVKDQGVERPVWNPSIKLIPNPAYSIVTVVCPELGDVGRSQIYVSDMSGRMRYESKMEGSAHVLRLDGLSAGVYFVVLETAKGVAVQKLVVE